MPKGSYGYLNHKRKTELIRTILFFSIAFGLYLWGYSSTGTQQNLFTILAVLGMLPACQRAVICVLAYKAVGTEKEDYELLNPVLERLGLFGLYDLFFTGEKENYAVGLACLTEKSLFFLCKKGDQLSGHLSPFLTAEGLEELNVTVFTDAEKLARALEENPALPEEELKERVYALLKAISL